MKNLGITTILAVLILGMPLLPLLAQDAAKPHESDQMPPQHQMMMGTMMEDCQKRCEVMSGTMADMTRTIEAAAKLTDVAKLHAALDNIQADVTKMEAGMKECKDMHSMSHSQ